MRFWLSLALALLAGSTEARIPARFPALTSSVADGMLMTQERHYAGIGSDRGPVRTVTYTRGADLSGSRQGAGGVGGLLARSEWSITSPQPSTSYYLSDAGGNITALVDTNGALVADYTYDPFGNVIRRGGTLAEQNTVRYSSKDYHARSGLYYYGFRFYDPNLQRWLNEDPIGEAGGVNLYRFVGNSPLNAVDTYGQDATGLFSAIGQAITHNVVTSVEEMFVLLWSDEPAPPQQTFPYMMPEQLPPEFWPSAVQLGEPMPHDLLLMGLGMRLPWGEGPGRKVARPCAAKGTTSLLPARSPWPGNSGFIEGTVERKFLMPGETIDRYGFGGGRFVSPAGTPVGARALRPGTENLPFNTYQVVKPFKVNAGGVQPWFGQPGLGTQYELPVSVNTLLNRGIIKPAP
jgi:RHS repeat-associated protein